MSKSLYEMSLEYDEAIAELETALAKTAQKRKKARLEGNEDEHQKLIRLTELYREELRDMKIISDTLKHYYDRDDEKRCIAV